MRGAAGAAERLACHAAGLHGDAPELLRDARQSGPERPEQVFHRVVAPRRGRGAAPEPDVLAALARAHALRLGRVTLALAVEEVLLVRGGAVVVVHAGLLTPAPRRAGTGTTRAGTALVPPPVVPAAETAGAAAPGAARLGRRRRRARRYVRGTRPRPPLGRRGHLLLERLRGPGVVLDLRVRVLVDAVLGEERVQVGVAAGAHLLELRGGPGIHPHRAHEGDVHAQPAVDPGALEAHEDAVRHGGPLGVLRVAVRADLRGGTRRRRVSPRRARRARRAKKRLWTRGVFTGRRG